MVGKSFFRLSVSSNLSETLPSPPLYSRMPVVGALISHGLWTIRPSLGRRSSQGLPFHAIHQCIIKRLFFLLLKRDLCH